MKTWNPGGSWKCRRITCAPLIATLNAHLARVKQVADGVGADHALLVTDEPLDQALRRYLLFRQRTDSREQIAMWLAPWFLLGLLAWACRCGCIASRARPKQKQPLATVDVPGSQRSAAQKPRRHELRYWFCWRCACCCWPWWSWHLQVPCAS